MSSSLHRVFEFGRFRLSEEEKCLWSGDQPVSLTPKAIDTLITLVRRNGHIVTRDELLETVWSDSFVEEHNINVCISMLRKALGRSPTGDSLIETVPRRGYRFKADVRCTVDEAEGDILVVERRRRSITTVEREVFTSPSVRSKYRPAIYTGLAVVVASVLLAGYYLGSQASQTPVARNAAAMEDYQAARQELRKRNVAESLRLFENAVRIDADFAEAWAGLAVCHAMLDTPAPQAEAAVSRAFEIAPDLTEAHAAKGFISFFHQWDWAAAENSLRRAISLDAKNVLAHEWLGLLLAARGDPKAAITEMKAALELDVTNLPVNNDLCQLFYLDRQYVEANVQCVKVIAADKTFRPVYENFFAAEAMRGSIDGAADALMVTLGKYPDAVAAIDESRRERSLKPYVEHQQKHLKTNATADYPAWDLAKLYALVGRRTEALEQLERAVEMRNLNAVFIKADPVFDGLRDEPRYQALIAKMNL